MTINREDLRMKSKNLLYPAGMYKGMVWTAGEDIFNDFGEHRLTLDSCLVVIGIFKKIWNNV